MTFQNIWTSLSSGRSFLPTPSLLTEGVGTRRPDGDRRIRSQTDELWIFVVGTGDLFRRRVGLLLKEKGIQNKPLD